MPQHPNRGVYNWVWDADTLSWIRQNNEVVLDGVTVTADGHLATSVENRIVVDTLTALNDTVEIELEGRTSVAMFATGGTMTLTPEVSIDGTTWHATGSSGIAGTDPVTGSGAAIAGGSANFEILRIGGTQKARIRASAYTSGTCTVTLVASSSPNFFTSVWGIVPGTSATNLGKIEDGQHTSGHTGIFVLGVRNDNPNAAVTTLDADYSQLSVYRTGSIRTAIPEEDFAALGSNHVKKYYTNAGAVTDGIVWSPAAGKRWYVTDITINVSAAATVTLEDDLAAGDSAVLKMEMAANSIWTHSYATPLFSGEDAADLLVTTTAGNIYITITGYEI